MLAAAVDQVHGFRAKPARRSDHVDRGVPGADACDSPSHRNFVERQYFRPLDEFQRAVNAVQILTGNIHRPGFSQAHSDEDRVEIFFQLIETDIASDFRLLPELDPQRLDHFHFAQRIGGAVLYAAMPYVPNPPGSSPRSKIVTPISSARQFRGARQRSRTRSDARNSPPLGAPAWNN